MKYKNNFKSNLLLCCQLTNLQIADGHFIKNIYMN